MILVFQIISIVAAVILIFHIFITPHWICNCGQKNKHFQNCLKCGCEISYPFTNHHH